MMNIKPIFVLTSAILLNACSNIPDDTSGIGSIVSPQQGNTGRYLKIDNPDLAEVLSIEDIKTRQVNGHLEANVTLISTGKNTQQLQYQFSWFDQEGFAVATGNSSWWPLQLHGGQIQALRAVAPTPNATTFNIYVREVHRKAYEFE